MTRTSQALPAAKETWARIEDHPRRLLVAAAVFHLVVATSFYVLGRNAVVPGTFDNNGIAVSFAPDGVKLRAEAAGLSDRLTRGQIREWLFATYPFHLKLYSVCFAFLGRWFGPTILSAEPLNAFCYLAILVLVFHLGQEIFNRRAGIIAAATVALWPSFLLHTTQLLKDPLFIVGMLAFVLVSLRLLSRNYTWSRSLLNAAVGGVIAVFTWIARDSMGEFLIATVALAGVMLIFRQFQEKHLLPANVVGMALLIVFSVGVTRLIPKYRDPIVPEIAAGVAGQNNLSPRDIVTTAQKPSTAQPLNRWSRLALRIGKMREQFVIQYPDSSSNIDSEVQLDSVTDLIRYLPRATMIGFFAPFPNMWFASGDKVGSTGRLVSGAETLAMYGIEVLAIVGFWRMRGSGRNGQVTRGRRCISAWLLGLIAATGMISLGLVVVNVGALYRLRYVFLLLLIILASGGAVLTFESFKQRRPDGSVPAADV
jgi:hypothetical protein